MIDKLCYLDEPAVLDGLDCTVHETYEFGEAGARSTSAQLPGASDSCVRTTA
ncbi:hypothetical protein [Haladaptatus sp. GCM10025893]|uniref:hypothetical protein n=1 Tax=Haladaptatus sp. GCM10025893 TaxID=3252659 RepID=UPI0036137C19